MAELAKAGDLCPNPACSDYEQLGGKIIGGGKTASDEWYIVNDTRNYHSPMPLL